MEGRMTEVRVAKGLVALIDDENLSLVMPYRWRENKYGYAVSEIYGPDSTKKVVFMHRLITNAVKGQIVDHINRDRLDNRRSNLRFVDKSQNRWNQGVRKDSNTGIKGVGWDATNKSWRVRFNARGITHWIGRFKDLETAKSEYLKAVLEVHGEFVPTFLRIPE
jgi:hypothetical protein